MKQVDNIALRSLPFFSHFAVFQSFCITQGKLIPEKQKMMEGKFT